MYVCMYVRMFLCMYACFNLRHLSHLAGFRILGQCYFNLLAFAETQYIFTLSG